MVKVTAWSFIGHRGTTFKVVKRRRANDMDTFSIVVKLGSIYGWSGLPPLIRGNSVITGFLIIKSSTDEMMKRLTTWLLIPLVAGAVATAWWNMWMYHGWIGCTGLLGSLIRADGEAAYNAMMAEMFIVALVIGTAAFVGARMWKQTTQGRRTTNWWVFSLRSKPTV